MKSRPAPRSEPSRQRAGARTTAALRIAASLAMLAGTVDPAHAACNLIPSNPDRFQGVIGATNRPFAGPGESVEIALLTDACDARSVGPAATAADHVATYVFKAGSGPAADVVVVAADCAVIAPQLQRCARSPGVQRTECVALLGRGGIPAIEMLERSGAPVFSLRFPDTDHLLGAAGDGLGLTGEVAVALTTSADPLPCALATATCAKLPVEDRLVACIDEMHDATPSCALEAGTLHPAFPHFVALPPINTPAAAPTSADPPATAFEGSDLLAATDAAGNLLLPINWRASSTDGPRVRIRAALDALAKRLGADVALHPDQVGVFTMWGRPLPALPTEESADARPSLLERLDVRLAVLRVTQRECEPAVAGTPPRPQEAVRANSECVSAAFGLPARAGGERGPVVLRAAASLQAGDLRDPAVGELEPSLQLGDGGLGDATDANGAVQFGVDVGVPLAGTAHQSAHARAVQLSKLEAAAAGR